MGAETDDPMDECVCGDYRRDHLDGTGACKHNKPRDLTHGYQDCLSFRLAFRVGERQAARASLHTGSPRP